jgi:hypothetical protein
MGEASPDLWISMNVAYLSTNARPAEVRRGPKAVAGKRAISYLSTIRTCPVHYCRAFDRLPHEPGLPI